MTIRKRAPQTALYEVKRRCSLRSFLLTLFSAFLVLVILRKPAPIVFDDFIAAPRSKDDEIRSRVTPCVPKEAWTIKGHSQSNEDLALLKHYYTAPTTSSSTRSTVSKRMRMCGGTIVEIGGLDGLQYSNSYYMEYALGWQALLIEALPSNYEKLVQNRPNAMTVHAAMCSGDDIAFRVGRSPATGGVASSMSETFKEKHGTEEIVRVPCNSMENILRQYSIQHIDVFVLDVEGAELEVLRTMGEAWKTVTVDVWVVELSSDNSLNNQEIRDLLAQHGYVKADWDIRDYCPLGGGCMENEVFERKGFTQSRQRDVATV